MRLCIILTFIFFKLSVLSTPSLILVFDDYSNDKYQVYKHVTELGYYCDTISSYLVTQNFFQNYDLVVICSGNNPSSCLYTEFRNAVINKIDNNGKVLIIGGQVGYNAAVYPLYLAFKNKVLHVFSWHNDNGFRFKLNNSCYGTNLASIPNILADTFSINRTGIYDVDIVLKDEFSISFFNWRDSTDYSGIIIYPDANNPGIIYYPFVYSKINNLIQAKQILENSLYNLLNSLYGIKYISAKIPNKFEIKSYPNPFNSYIMVTIELPKSSHLSELNIYDINGRKLEEILKDKRLNSGSYVLQINLNEYSSGVYLIGLEFDDSFFYKKIVMVK